MRNETQGSQIKSSIKLLLSNSCSSLKEIVMYSDTYGGQNKNNHFVAMCLSLIKNHLPLNDIDNTLLMVGHTRFKCDSNQP